MYLLGFIWPILTLIVRSGLSIQNIENWENKTMHSNSIVSSVYYSLPNSKEFGTPTGSVCVAERVIGCDKD